MQSADTTGCAGRHASDPLPAPSAAATAAAEVGGSGQQLSHYIRSYDNSLPQEFCSGLIASFNRLAHLQQRNGRGIRAGLDDSAWSEMDMGRLADAPFQAFFRSLISTALRRYNADVGLPIAVPDSPLLSPLILKRYRAGSEEKFQTHFDSINQVCDRYMVFLWYLNTVELGGQTWFPGLQHGVQPMAGRLLMFPPYWMYAHQGRVSPEQDKYILSTYLRFTQT